MIKTINLNKKIQLLLLFIFPFFYIVTGGYFRSLLGDLSLRSIDPDYVYFSNALGVSLGNFDTGNIFHPGSPLQYFAAIIFRLVYVLRSPGTTYLEDIFTHPDIYLSVVSFSFTGIFSIILFISGWYIFKITNSILSAFLIQTTPFLPIIWYDLIGRITPEVFQAIAVLALSVVAIKYYRQELKINSFSNIILLAFISAFGLSAKITFLPLLVIPLFMIDNWRKKILYLAATILIFVLISVSVLLKAEVFWNWIKNIFVHSGDYGAGDTTIIDFQQFKTNLLFLVRLEKFFFQVVLLSFLVLIVYITAFRKKAKKRIVLFSISIILAIVFHLIIVSKHFAHRNFIPSLLLMPLLVFFSVEMIKMIHDNKFYRKAVEIIILLFLVLIIKNQLIWIPIKSNAMDAHMQALVETQSFVSTIEDGSIKIIASQNYGAPFIEYTLMYSTVWSDHSLKPLYADVLAKLYPNTYLFTTWDDRFQYWGSSFDAQQIIDSGKKIYLYLERDDEQLYNRTIAKMKEVSTSDFSADKVLLYRNPVTTEIIYLLKFNKTQAE